MTPQTPDAMTVRALACALELDARALADRAESDQRIPVAISSEMPVERIDWTTGERYLEVLDHSPSSVDMAWARRGIPLLLSHDSRDQYGLVTDLTLGEDRRLRGWIKFSRGQKAQEIRQDIEDGIRPMVSVGYQTGEQYTTERAADGMAVRRFTRWTVYEVSTVPIPADPSVGIGRSHSVSTDVPSPAADQATRSELVDNTTTVATAPEPVAAPVVTDVRSRSETIYGFAASAGLSAREADALVASGRDIDSIGKELLERMNKQADHAAAPQPAVQLTEREQKQYSLTAALNAIASGRRDGFEFEVSDEFAKKTGRSYTNNNSFFLPLNVRTQLAVGTANKGGELRATELRPELIDLLRQRSLALQLGARFMPGLVGNVAFPRQTAGTTAEWVAEGPSSDMSLSSLSLDQVTLSPKTLQASTSVSRQLLAQSTPAADQVVFDDILAQHAVAIDKAVFWGTGANNQPTGVGVASGTNVVAMGTSGGALSLSKFLEGLKEIEIDNAMTDNVVFVTTPGVKYKAAETAKVASTDSVMLWDILTSTVMGTPAYSTNNVPSTLTKGQTSGACHGGIIGDFSQVMVGEWGAGAEIIVDPYSLARKNLVQITSIQFADVQVRVPSAFAVYRDFTI